MLCGDRYFVRGSLHPPRFVGICKCPLRSNQCPSFPFLKIVERTGSNLHTASPLRCASQSATDPVLLVQVTFRHHVWMSCGLEHEWWNSWLGPSFKANANRAKRRLVVCRSLLGCPEGFEWPRTRGTLVCTPWVTGNETDPSKLVEVRERVVPLRV